MMKYASSQMSKMLYYFTTKCVQKILHIWSEIGLTPPKKIKNERKIIMAINEIQTNINQTSTYGIMQTTVKTNEVSKTGTTEEQIVSKKIDTFTMSNSSEDISGIYSPETVSVNSTNSTNGTAYSISYKSEYCYSQTGSNNYGYSNAKSSCATFALATALSIRNDEKITPDQIETNSSTDGHGTKWASHGAKKYDCSKESDVYTAIDKQLAAGKPVLVHATGKSSSGSSSEHWATVVGKKSDGTYRIIDPWDGTEKDLSQMQIYKNSGKLVGYATLS